MKNKLTLIIVLLTSLAANASNTAAKADEEYNRENYKEAIALYEEAIKTDGVSSDLFYNLGNAHYRAGNVAESILAYERAMRLNPSNDEARSNLEFVNSRIIDKKGETGSFIYNTFVGICNKATSNTWAWIGLALFALTIGCVFLYTFSDAVLVKKIGFFGGIAALAVTIFIIIIAFKAKQLAQDRSEAIITSETSVLSTVPRAPMTRDEEAMLLHEGTKVWILQSISLPGDSLDQTWHEVSVDNRHRAWINDADIERVIK